MKFSILTIFPEIFNGFLQTSLIGKAVARNKLQFRIVNIRDYAAPPHYQVDDLPYGGGAGMVLKPEPIARAIEACKEAAPRAKTILLSASGELFNQQAAHSLSREEEIIFICPRYEGVDQRIVEKYVDQEISIGNYVLMGGEVAAMAVIEAVTRLIPEIIGNEASLEEESFNISDERGLLIEAPHYTRPAEFQGMKVPEVLTGGDHKKINAWRRQKASEKRESHRPDLKVK